MRNVAAIFFLLVSAAAAALNPSPNYRTTPDALNLRYTPQFIATPDSAKILSWIFSPDSTTRNITIIIAGPDAGNMSSQLLLAEALVNTGFDVITFDYRGFGHSSAFRIDSSYLYYSEFITDLVSVIKKAETAFPKNKTCVLARSMGSIIEAIAFRDAPVDYIIGDGFIKNITATKKRIEAYKHISLKLPADSMRFSNAIAAINAKMLLFAGKQDWVVTLAEAQAIVENNYNRKLIIHSAGHLEAPKALTQQTYADGMMHEITVFFEQYKE
jgi:pimeloyl-ACP methyl ester carboxylesterase